jgi:hypothetical protein
MLGGADAAKRSPQFGDGEASDHRDGYQGPEKRTSRAAGPAIPSPASRARNPLMAVSEPDIGKGRRMIRRAVPTAAVVPPSARTNVRRFASSRDPPNTRLKLRKRLVEHGAGEPCVGQKHPPGAHPTLVRSSRGVHGATLGRAAVVVNHQPSSDAPCKRPSKLFELVSNESRWRRRRRVRAAGWCGVSPARHDCTHDQERFPPSGGADTLSG